MKNINFKKWVNNLTHKQFLYLIFGITFFTVYLLTALINGFVLSYISLVACFLTASLITYYGHTLLDFADASKEFYKLYNEMGGKLSRVENKKEFDVVKEMLPDLKSKVQGREHLYYYNNMNSKITVHKKYLN